MNLRKLNLGLVALLLGFGLVLTQSAFKASSSNVTTKTWGKDASGYWHDRTLVLGTCEEEGPVCEGIFEDGVDPNEPIDPMFPNVYPQPISTTEGTFLPL